ncbi:MAG TPA: hypothetical protein V6C71_21290 [Coleofasciculaceae cyanobacterium]|jgi:hypothetical protein
MESLPNCTSANFEQAALAKFRSLVSFLPQDSKIFREPWGRSTVLCLDFENCPHLFDVDQEQDRLISQAIARLGLANSMTFRIGSKTIGWKQVKP